MADPSSGFWTVLGFISSFVSFSLFSSASRSATIINVLENITEIDLLSTEESHILPINPPNVPLAISGEVLIYPTHTPLISLNGEKCVIIEEVSLVRTLYPTTTQDVERSRIYKEERFGLGREGKVEPFVSIDRNAVMNQLSTKLSEKLRYTGSIRSILKPGGAILEDNDKATMIRLLQFLFGFVEGPILKSQSVLGLSSLITIVGRLEVLSGGRWMLTADQTLGELLFFPRRNLLTVLNFYKTSFLWQSLSAMFLAIAAVRSLQLDSIVSQFIKLKIAQWRDSETSSHQTGGTNGTIVGSCVVCLERQAATVCVPCGHRSLCNQCSVQLSGLLENKCPICRTVVERCIRVFD
jgi:hypothetical protein